MEVSTLALTIIVNSTGLQANGITDLRILQPEDSSKIVVMMISPKLRPIAKDLFTKKFETFSDEDKKNFDEILQDAVYNTGSGRNPFL